ncbi:calcium-translocating P-type ATPase, PMCA-type family protein (macronuclear) [Tetrahymena thermophila SB210]|uniref:Calcium-translocating P-type ATPase, PMCA-type family protein n=1 Tax=Tetrahymena thermophila (strain SB210) TaxID=312017 RepID=I7LX11_TETTS|nr:calcium-translocating P-type ATPase, PMCA-type family protein [Tetrahymena thermophila SB210]EAS03235.2 calcium-translocating P-type ATPase, PMCA-type family protein [Tetrahymena thermophila SB210]|eukprot:XP_001023480.2 calcium-translocating P-type ATPase, PMCA-type family protein [Tetrahymena thermophila SB210]
MKEQSLAEGYTSKIQKFQFKNPIPILQDCIAEIDSVKRIEKCVQGLQIISDAFHQEDQLEQILQQHELVKLLLIVKYIAGSQVDMILDFLMEKYIKNSNLIDAIFKACAFFSVESEKDDLSFKDYQQNQTIIQQSVYFENKEDVKQLQYRHINKIYFTEIIQNNIIEIKQLCFDYSFLVIESFLQKKFTDQQEIDGIINIYLQFYDFSQNESIKQRVKQLLVKYKQDYPWILQNKLIRIKVYRILGINKKQKSLDNISSPQVNSNYNVKSENKNSNLSNLSSYQTSDLDGEEDEELENNQDILQTYYSEDNRQFSLVVQKQKPSNKIKQNDYTEKIEEKVRSQSFEEKSPTNKGKNKSVFFAQDDSLTSSPKGSPSKNSQQGTFEDFKSATFSLKLQKTPSNKLLKLEQKVQSSPTVHKIQQQQKAMGSQKIEEWIINSSKEDLFILKNDQTKATFKSSFSLSLVILFIIKPKDMPLNKELLRKEEMKGVIFEAPVGFRRSLAEMFAARPWEINSYIFRSFKAMEFLLIYENFEYLLRFNNVVEMFFEELNKVMLNSSCCNYNHVANCIEFFLKYVPEMTLIEMTKYNILYHLIGFFDYPQVQRLFYLLFNINYKNEYPVQDHLLKKFWEYTQTTYLFRELLTMMLFCDLKKLRKMYKEEHLQSKPTSDIITYFSQQRKKLKDFESLKVYNKSVAEEEFGFAVDIDKIKTNIVKSRMSVLKGAFSRGLIQISQNLDPIQTKEMKQIQAQKKQSISSKRGSLIQNNQSKQNQENETNQFQNQPEQSQHLKMVIKGNKNVQKFIQQNQQQMKFSDIVEIAKKNKQIIIQNDQNLKEEADESKNQENGKKLQNQQEDKRKTQNANSKRNRSTSYNNKNDNINQSFTIKNQKEFNSKSINKINDSTTSNSFVINSVANQKRRSISERNLSSLRCKTESSQISNKFLPEITLNQSFYMKMQKKEEVSDSIKKLSQKELQLLKTVKIVNQNGVNRVMPQLFNVKLLNKQESYLNDLNKLGELYPAQNDFFYNQSQNDVLAEQTYFSLDTLIQNDTYSHTIAQFIFNLLRNIIQEECEEDLFKLLNLKTFDYEHLLDCIIFSDQQYNLFEYIMKNYIFKLKIHPITPENSAFVCGKMINWFLSNSNHKLLQKYKEQINLVAKRHFKILCKLIINSYGWKLKKSDSFLKLQKDQLIDQPIGSARLLLLETLYLIIKEETEHKVEMIEFIPETCWNALFNFFFNDKNNTVYHAKFFQFYEECLQYFKMHTFFSIWIKLNYIQNLLTIHENIHQHDSLKFYLKKFVLSIIQLIEQKHIEMSSLSQILSSSESWKIISKPYIQNSIPSLQELNTTKQGFKKSIKSFSKFKDDDINSSQKLIKSQNFRSSSSEKHLPSKQKSYSSEQYSEENKIKSTQQNLITNKNIEKSQIIKQIANNQNIIKVNSDQSESIVKRLDEKANKIIQMAWQNTVFFNQVMTKKKNQIDFEEMPFLKK